MVLTQAVFGMVEKGGSGKIRSQDDAREALRGVKDDMDKGCRMVSSIHWVWGRKPSK